MEDLWERALQDLRGRVSSENFDTWLAPLSVERAENAFKVTDDVYLARLYSAALSVYRADPWRAGIDRKLTIIRDTYGMLNAEVQTRRAELLEIAIILLIVFEILLSLIQR